MRQGPHPTSLSKMDGLRGIAAIIVVFSHALFWFYPAMHLGERTKGRPMDGIDWFNSPFSFFYRGGFSVSMFFILSGLVLTYSVAKHTDVLLAIRKAALKRYVRLGVPVAASVLIGCALMKLGMFTAPDVLPVPVLSTPYLFQASWDTAARDALYGALALGDSRYNYVLWTIQIELIGSFAIYAGFALFGANSLMYRTFCLIAFFILSSSPNKLAMYSSLFFLGSMLMTFNYQVESHEKRRGALCLVGLFMGIYLAGFHSASASYSGINGFTRIISEYTGYRPSWLLIMPALGALLIVVSVLNAPNTFKVLDSRLMKWLGRTSFSVYLLHTFILVLMGQTFTHYLGMTVQAMLLTLFTTLGITLVVAHIYYLKIDVTAIALANKVSVRLFDKVRPSVPAIPDDRNVAPGA